MTHDVALALGAGGEDLGIGAALRLGHGEAGDDFVVEKRLEEQPLVFVGSVVGEDLGVAGVGRLAAENGRAEIRPAEDFVEQRQLDLTVALAAEFRAQMAGPKLAFAHFLLQRPDELVAPRVLDVARVSKDKIERFDLLADEGVDPIKLDLKIRLCLKIPHRGLSAMVLKAIRAAAGRHRPGWSVRQHRKRAARPGRAQRRRFPPASRSGR